LQNIRWKPGEFGFLRFCISYSCFISNEELDYWETVGIINSSNKKEILEWKSELSSTDLEKSEIIKIITMILEPSFQLFIELISMYNIFTRKLVEEKRLSLSNNSFDLLNNYLTGERQYDVRNSNSIHGSPIGLLGRIVQDCLYHKLNQRIYQSSSGQSSSSLMQLLEHVENPLQQLAKKGLGFLSRGLGRLVLLAFLLFSVLILFFSDSDLEAMAVKKDQQIIQGTMTQSLSS
jgi:hypothetical protein